ncbi:SDR family NAD(P)-dependent oxidoreductase [Streptomyces shenzhenensis]|uniref:SDR family NAD(P)-dependent oxidoreductase n=1 Tax=Streptomyces shenzhenensis TaxID=943815 RepID=UPI001C68F138|nr:SDR family oxidoreductase [Streptomyces shenzhenensis]
MIDLDGKVAVVTGAASGIGRAITRGFVAAGARVVAADVDEAGVARTAELCTDPGAVVPLRADVSDPADVAAAVEAAERTWGRLTTMVNNAAVSIPGNVLETSVEDFDRMLAVNLRGVFLGCKYAVPALLRAGGGSVINMGSVNSLVAEPVLAGYTASKGGVLMLTKAVARDFAALGVRCNCICPGWVDTPINLAHAERMGGIEAVREGLPDWQPLGREGRPDEIASVALFLASDLSTFMTGSAVVADGGMTAI